ncbi:MAG: class II aldolase/adducin family protein [Alphaproteobacteria bacterium]
MERGERELRQRMIEAFGRLAAMGLGPPSAASLAVRHGPGLLVTPADAAEGGLAPHDVVQLDAEGCFAAGHRPAPEWRLHQTLLAGRSDVAAVLQCQSPSATALACLEERLPPVHARVAIAGGHEVPIAAYAGFATAALGAAVLDVIGDRRACLMAHHGLVVLATEVEEATRLAREVEALCAAYLAARAVREPPLLSAAEMDTALAKFARLRDGLDPLD